MSRIARKPLLIPQGVEVKLQDEIISVKGKKGQMTFPKHTAVEVKIEGNEIKVTAVAGQVNGAAMLGTTCVLINNMLHGVSVGFEKKLTMIGVGYRAKVKGKVLEVTAGYSHPVDFPIPEGVNIECPSQTEIVVKGIDKQIVGQVAANIRSIRPPEPYKGKGIRYADEVVIRKETKKK